MHSLMEAIMDFKEASEMRYNTHPVETFVRPME